MSFIATRLLAAGLLTTLVLAIGCHGDKAKEQSKLPPPPLEGTQWNLVELPLQPLAIPKPGPDGQAPTIRFDAKETEKRVTGYSGLNQFNGTYQISGKTLRFGPLAATKRAGPPELMNLESVYIKSLLATTGWRIEGQTLDLLGYDGKPVARFRPGAAAPATDAQKGPTAAPPKYK